MYLGSPQITPPVRRLHNRQPDKRSASNASLLFVHGRKGKSLCDSAWSCCHCRYGAAWRSAAPIIQLYFTSSVKDASSGPSESWKKTNKMMPSFKARRHTHFRELLPLTHSRTTFCGIDWALRWRMATAARRRWRPTRKPSSCSRASSGPATTWESAALTWGHTGKVAQGRQEGGTKIPHLTDTVKTKQVIDSTRFLKTYFGQCWCSGLTGNILVSVFVHVDKELRHFFVNVVSENNASMFCRKS